MTIALKTFGYVFAALVFYGCILSIIYAFRASMYAALVLTLVGACFFVLMLYAKRKSKRRSIHDSNASTSMLRRFLCIVTSWRFFQIVFCVCVPLMFCVSMFLLGRSGTDYTQVFELTTASIRGDELPFVEYYYANPHLHFYSMIMRALFATAIAIVPGISDEALMSLHVLINAAMILLSIYLVAKACRLLWGERQGAVCGIALLIYAPFWSNSANPYTDTAAMLFVSIALFLVARFLVSKWLTLETGFERGAQTAGRRRKAIIKAVLLVALFGLICGVGFEFKATVAILIVAFVIVTVTKLGLVRACALNLIVLLTFGMAVVLCNACVDVTRSDDLPYDQQLRYETEFPYEHWMMIGLNQESHGRYTFDDYQYTLKFVGKDAKRAADLEKIQERIAMLGGPAGAALYMLTDKSTTQWAVGGFFLEDTFENSSALAEEEGWDEKTGKLQMLLSIYSNYAQAYHILMLFAVGACSILWTRVIGCRRDANNRSSSISSRELFVLFCMLSLFGLGLFLCVFWEVKSRYLLQFAPMLIILACVGVFQLWQSFSHSQKHSEAHSIGRT